MDRRSCGCILRRGRCLITLIIISVVVLAAGITASSSTRHNGIVVIDIIIIGIDIGLAVMTVVATTVTTHCASK